MSTKIYVSGKYMKANNKIKNKLKTDAGNDLYLGAVLSINRDKIEEEAHEAHIVDSDGNIVAKVDYDPFIKIGAKVWIETELEVRSIVNKY